jgi:hypothetical protein
VGKPGYKEYGSHAADARGAINNILPPDARGLWDPKCNQFVWDALTAGGVQPKRMGDGRIPLAGDWGDPKGQIGGYSVVTDAPQPGDVVSDGHHVGIYLPLPDGRPGTISAASPWSLHGGILGEVVHNDWGFRPKQHPVIWRPTAPQGR